MAKHKPIIAFDAKLYKHFAIITIALTASITIFADGESRKAVAETAEVVATYEPEKPKVGRLIIKNNSAGSGAAMDSFYRESSVELGDDAASGGSIQNLGALTRVSRIDKRRLAQLGLTLQEFNALSDEEKAKILKQLNNGSTIEERQTAIENASASSLKRSGRSEASADF